MPRARAKKPAAAKTDAAAAPKAAASSSKSVVVQSGAIGWQDADGETHRALAGDIVEMPAAEFERLSAVGAVAAK